MTRFHSRLLVLTVAVLATLGVISPASAATEPYCGITWGSGPKAEDPREDSEVLLGIRSGRHACFDRLVIDVGGQDASFNSYDVRYVPLVYSEGKGDPVPVRGAADLQIIVRAPAHDSEYRPTFTPANPREVVNLAGYQTFRQLAWAGSFEGQTTLALGVRARLPFRVFTLDGTPNSDHTPRLVIDVARYW